jgi:hypothetical protein
MQHDSGESAGVRCPNGNMPIFANGKAACPDCGEMVRVRLVDGLWCFVPHDAVGREVAQ